MNEVHEDLKLSPEELAAHFGVVRTTYVKNETGSTFPSYPSLHVLSHTFNVSLDWLIADKGPRYFREKELETTPSPVKTELESAPVLPLDKEEQELVACMAQIPLLKHEVMAFFLRFKENNPELIARYQNHGPQIKE